MTKTSDKSLYLVVVASVIHSAASRKFFAANTLWHCPSGQVCAARQCGVSRICADFYSIRGHSRNSRLKILCGLCALCGKKSSRVA
jgi:hypothetical protein